jgi:hypothetical protein
MKRMRVMSGTPLVAVILIISCLTMVQAAAPKSVRDPLGRFTISVPAMWNIQTSTSSRAAAVTAKAPIMSGHLPDSVDVIVQDTFSALSPQACIGEADTVMRFTIHNWTTVQQGATRLGSMPAYARSYVWRAQTGEQRRSVQTCVTLGRRAFIVVGTTANTPITVRQNLPQLQQIMNTFHLLASAPPSAAPTTPAPGG